jgi:hypothetical protein
MPGSAVFCLTLSEEMQSDLPAWQVDEDYEITFTVNSVSNTPDLEYLM